MDCRRRPFLICRYSQNGLILKRQEFFAQTRTFSFEASAEIPTRKNQIQVPANQSRQISSFLMPPTLLVNFMRSILPLVLALSIFRIRTLDPGHLPPERFQSPSFLRFFASNTYLTSSTFTPHRPSSITEPSISIAGRFRQRCLRVWKQFCGDCRPFPTC